MEITAKAAVLLECFDDLDVSLQDVGEKFREADALACSSVREVLPDSSLNGCGQKYWCVRWDTMTAACSFAEVNLS